LAHRAEAFQQEPETLFAYYNQRKRWGREGSISPELCL